MGIKDYSFLPLRDSMLALSQELVDYNTPFPENALSTPLKVKRDHTSFQSQELTGTSFKVPQTASEDDINQYIKRLQDRDQVHQWSVTQKLDKFFLGTVTPLSGKPSSVDIAIAIVLGRWALLPNTSEYNHSSLSSDMWDLMEDNNINHTNPRRIMTDALASIRQIMQFTSVITDSDNRLAAMRRLADENTISNDDPSNRAKHVYASKSSDLIAACFTGGALYGQHISNRPTLNAINPENYESGQLLSDEFLRLLWFWFKVHPNHGGCPVAHEHRPDGLGSKAIDILYIPMVKQIADYTKAIENQSIELR